MVNVDIDKSLYEDVKKLIKKNKYDYPSVKFFVQKAVYNEIISKNGFDHNDINGVFSKLKELLQNNPELKSKVDEIYSEELKKIKKGALQ